MEIIEESAELKLRIAKHTLKKISKETKTLQKIEIQLPQKRKVKKLERSSKFKRNF